MAKNLTLFAMKISKQTWLDIVKIITTATLSVLATLGITSCGVTKASIVQPKDGSVTSITITTNNPIETTVNPNTSATYNPKN